ncbi:hypothetical protein HK405_005318 [Cladochytrium tenue]|nr:hypothetical protein HK405_005318 [Cladochytrium tenue]
MGACVPETASVPQIATVDATHTTTTATTDLSFSTASDINTSDAASTASLNHMFGIVSATLNYTAVVLPHSSHVSSVACNSTNLDVYFADDDAYEYIKQHWPLSNFLLITDSPNYTQAEDSVHTYWLVQDLVFSDWTRSVQAAGREIGIENAVGQIEVGPPPYIHGLPTAACGFDFDDAVDKKLGFYDLKNKTELLEFNAAYETPEVENSDNNGHAAIGRREPRCLTCTAKTLGKRINQESKVSELVSTSMMSGIFSKSATAVVPTTAFNSTNSTKLDNVSRKISLFCVDCHVFGTGHIHGSASFSVFRGLTAASVTFNGSLEAGLYLGLDASVWYTYNMTKNIMKIPIPGANFKIPKVLSIGAFVQVSVEAKFTITASGQVLAGAGMVVDNLHASLDFLNGGNNKIDGFKPIITKKFSASAQVTTSVEVGLPFELGIEMDVPLLGKSWAVGLKDTPAVTGSVTADLTIHPSIQQACSNGVEVDVTFR